MGEWKVTLGTGFAYFTGEGDSIEDALNDLYNQLAKLNREFANSVNMVGEQIVRYQEKRP